ncbi:3'-5' exonuclease [Segetibacter sp. 3557_3]|uniref:3'-5' exonuclease n=1 Tax=Segetibacter sp. 3557_3 TaxID=2547429 RepID=UPI001058B705|nr:3'-5' exonuclease [Segetibacter sp. 3557_3]TDH27076.1 3'-5' exonuclease [Segetibacter sp. 3557_3]
MLDIETVPCVSSYENLAPEWKELFFDKVSKTMPETELIDNVYKQKAGILAEFGRIVCISTGFFYNDANGKLSIKLKSICCDDEVELLKAFIELVNKFLSKRKNLYFAGHNIREFDIPFICRRLVINRVALPSYFQIQGAKPWEINMLDTMQWWKFGDYKNYTSLHLLANVLGVPTSKTDMDGSMVQDVYYEDNDLPRIVDYCQRDVVVVAQVILRFKNLPLVDKENISVVD